MAKAGTQKSLSPKEAEKKRALWNVYEWDRPEQYDYVKLLKGDRLRWEFLRRDENYRADWLSKKSLAHTQYGLREWHNPSATNAPKFMPPCHLVEFSKRDPMEKILHYEALAGAKSLGALIFWVDVDYHIKPQLTHIKKVHEEIAKIMYSPEERRKRGKRKNNRNGRSPAFLLRVLDAYNERIPVKVMAGTFGGRDGITESAMRRTIDFAQNYWRRF